MRIRPANLEDIQDIITLATHAVRASQWSREQYEKALNGIPPQRLVLILEIETNVVGFLVGRAIDHEWELENIAVSADVHRRGLGSLILNEFLNMARQEKAEAVFLEVRESNRSARAFYEKWGFTEAGRRPRYYMQPDEDAVVYRLSIDVH